MGVIKIWCKKNLPLLSPNKSYSSIEKKVISKDFDTELIDVLNRYEYSNISEKTKLEIREILLSSIKALPLKK